MISFYPGPSKVWDSLPLYMEEAWAKGILSVNHRSREFMEVSSAAIGLLHEKLNIPAHYSVLFTSSATESWEIIAQSVIGNAQSVHLFNGAFGEKWFEYTQKITGQAVAHSFLPEELPKPSKLEINEAALLLALTHNETSNGTALTDAFLGELRACYPKKIIAVDATSSMGGVKLPFETADIWFASVQKCFGLPAGLGLLVCSPEAIERAEELNENKHYNSLLFMHRMMTRAQTTYTPNVLGIYLLMRSLQDSPSVEKTASLINHRFQSWVRFFKEFKRLSMLIQVHALRSQTVLPILGAPEDIEQIKIAAKAEGLYLGNGYGSWQQSTFRIANFPALTEKEIEKLKDFLTDYLR